MQQQKGRGLRCSIDPSLRLGTPGVQPDQAAEDAHQRGILMLAGADAQGRRPLAFIMQLTQQKMQEAGKPQLDLGREKHGKNAGG